MASNIINIDTLFYIPHSTKKDTFKGVGDSSGLVEFINREDRDFVHVFSENTEGISKVKFKELCIAWLALNYPDVLVED